MNNFHGSVAVVTGAGSGIGQALATEAVRRGMRVVVSDIRRPAVDAAAAALAAAGGEVLAVCTDVTKANEIDALVAAAVDRFGKINLMINNAGAFVAGLAWETSVEQYDWLIDLNLKSVLHGIRASVPRMIAQGDPCHVVTVASGAAVTVLPAFAAYSATKHAALAATEALRLDLAAEDIRNIGVTVVMPGMIQTAITEPEKASPADLNLGQQKRFENRTVRATERMLSNNLASAMAPEVLALQVFDAIADDRLYVLPNHDSPDLQALIQSIATGRATGVDPFPPLLEWILGSMARADACSP